MPTEAPAGPRLTNAGSASDDAAKISGSLPEPERRRDRTVRADRRRQMAAAHRARGRRNPDAVFRSGLVRAGGGGTSRRTPARGADDRQAGAAEVQALVIRAPENLQPLPSTCLSR